MKSNEIIYNMPEMSEFVAHAMFHVHTLEASRCDTDKHSLADTQTRVTMIRFSDLTVNAMVVICEEK